MESIWSILIIPCNYVFNEQMLDSYPQKNENINWRSQLLTKLKTISIITRPDIRNHYAGRGQVCLHSHLVPSWGLDARNSAAWADPVPLLGIALCFGATHNMFGTPGTPTICWRTCLQLLWNHSWKHIRGVRNNHHCGKDRFQYKKTLKVRYIPNQYQFKTSVQHKTRGCSENDVFATKKHMAIPKM